MNRKLRIADRFLDDFNYFSEDGVSTLYSHYTDAEIDVVNLQMGVISKFRKMLHIIIDKEDLNCKDELHAQVSNNNFTAMILLGFLNVID